MSTHSVESHLQVSAEAYDAAIRTFVPYYEEMLKGAIAAYSAYKTHTGVNAGREKEG